MAASVSDEVKKIDWSSQLGSLVKKVENICNLAFNQAFNGRVGSDVKRNVGGRRRERGRHQLSQAKGEEL